MARINWQAQKLFEKGDNKIIALKNKQEQIQNKTPAGITSVMLPDKTNHVEHPQRKNNEREITDMPVKRHVITEVEQETPLVKQSPAIRNTRGPVKENGKPKSLL